MDELLDLLLKTYGIAGFLVLLPAVAAWLFWKQNNKLHAEVVQQMTVALEAQKQRVEDQAARVADTERMMAKLLEIVREQTALNTETNSILARLSESVDKLERHALSDRTR